MSVISTDYTTFFFFFIVCIHRHGMMELQLMSRNEFLLCLIKTKQNKKNSCSWQHTSTKHHAHGPDCTIFMKASGSREHVNYMGPQNAFRIVKSHSQDKKAKPTLRNIKKIKRVYHEPKGTPNIQNPYKQVLLCILGNGAQLECGKEWRCFFNFFFMIK